MNTPRPPPPPPPPAPLMVRCPNSYQKTGILPVRAIMECGYSLQRNFRPDGRGGGTDLSSKQILHALWKRVELYSTNLSLQLGQYV